MLLLFSTSLSIDENRNPNRKGKWDGSVRTWIPGPPRGVHRPRDLPDLPPRLVPVGRDFDRVPGRGRVRHGLGPVPPVRHLLRAQPGRRAGRMLLEEGALLPPLRSHPHRRWQNEISDDETSNNKFYMNLLETTIIIYVFN
ncbi:F-box protein PP2-B10-like isoform X1 [Iris pallida]|uniref:F-box protein PP2-B10-like isoform X1 n=1 Tax=Iris pallida TaxID=29817 RepID=A0AAX6FVS4_IRIPA|nr:F-box protein PP2-B10-like isoform X1 [Iris pallida]